MVTENSKMIIWNLALYHLGSDKAIGSLTERTKEANAARRFYGIALEMALRTLKPKWAEKVAELVEVDDDVEDAENLYSYRYPTDCVFFQKIQSGLRNENKAAHVYFKLSSDDDGQLIITDMDEAVGEYIRMVDNPQIFTSDFTIALSYLLASLMATSLTAGDPFKLKDTATNLFKKFSDLSAANETNEQQVEDDCDYSILGSR